MAITYDPARDFYVWLKVNDGDGLDKIMTSYRRLARELHPDTNPDPNDEDRFKEVSEAYACLSEAGPRREYDEAKAAYFDRLPPALRLGDTCVDFGRARAGDKVECSVLIYNDGGNGVCSMTAHSGHFWKLEAQAPSDDDPADAVGKLVFILCIDVEEAAAILEEEIKVFLENDTDVSAQKLYLRVDVQAAPEPAKPKASGGRSKSVPIPRPVRRAMSTPVNLNPATWRLTPAEKVCAWLTAAGVAAFWIIGFFNWPEPLATSERFMHILNLLIHVPAPVLGVVVIVLAAGLIALYFANPAAFATVVTAGAVAGMVVYVYTKLTIMALWWIARAIRAAYKRIGSP